MDDLNEKLTLAEAKIKGGVILQSNADVIKVEALKTKQSIEELKSIKIASINALNELCKDNISYSETFEAPSVEIQNNSFDKKK